MTKTFTPKLANRALPLVRSIVTDILEKAQELRGKKEKTDDEPPPDELDQMEQEILVLMEELEQLGCSFRDWDFEVGLVDFPAEIDGRQVMLCWRSDEPAVRYYHTEEGGFAGRRPIPAELLEGLGEN